jgi:hypothetical protein
MNCPACDTPCRYTFITDDIAPTPENGEKWAHNALRYPVCRGDGFLHFRAVYNALVKGEELTVHRLALLAGSELAERHEAARKEVAKIGK